MTYFLRALSFNAPWRYALAVWLALPAVLGADVAEAAQSKCAPVSTMHSFLRSEHGEVPVAMAIRSNGHLMQVLVNEEKGTWTIITIAPGSDRACAIEAGTNWFLDRSSPGLPS